MCDRCWFEASAENPDMDSAPFCPFPAKAGPTKSDACTQWEWLQLVPIKATRCTQWDLL